MAYHTLNLQVLVALLLACCAASLAHNCSAPHAMSSEAIADLVLAHGGSEALAHQVLQR